LCGAGAAALLAGILLGIFGGPSLLIVVAVLALAGAALFKRPQRLGWGPLGAVLLLLIVNLVSPIIVVPTVKGVRADRTVFERWNAFSRVTVELMKDEWMIKIDNSAATQVTPASVAASARWKSEISAIAYAMFDGGPENSLIIGPGGGRDVAHALGAGTKRVTGVEVNPIIARVIMQGKFLAQSEGLYKDPRVRIVVDDGRSFVRRSKEHYDVIQASLVDTWAATAAGAFALTENTLYTMEAFGDYYDHLSDDGILTMTRWYTGDHGETARLVVLAAGALERRGVAPGATRRHIILIQHGSLGTLIAKKNELTDAEIARLQTASNAAGFSMVLGPGIGDGSGLADMVDNGAWSDAVLGRAEDLRPPTDDRPFFFYFVKPGTLLRRLANVSGTTMADAAVWILIAAGASVAAFALAFILLPLLLHKRGVLRGGTRRDLARRLTSLGYFVLIGLAFMVVEMALMQKFALFLGHPSYALLVVLFSLLAGTAIGARLSGRLSGRLGGHLPLAAAGATAVLAMVYAFVLGPALQSWVAWALPARIVLSGVLVSLCGLAMGMLLPSGVKLTAKHDAELIPWGWGLNGAASVIGTVGATITAIQVGFRTTLVLGGILYLLAGGAATLLSRLARDEVNVPPESAPADEVVTEAARAG
jgi:spermidine synthase